jgi:hypothetical protein
MWVERRTMADQGRRGQARHAALDAIDEDRPGPTRNTLSNAGGRAGRRLEDRTPSGHHLHSGADVIRHQNAERVPTRNDEPLASDA